MRSKAVVEAPQPAIEAPLEIVRVHPPVHPGAILREEFMEPLGVTAYAVAKACHMNRSKLERIAREELGISGDTAVRLGRYFGTSDQFWMNLQATYEVLKARQEIGAEAAEIQPLQAAE
jgi:addiction module HigA family antidote